MKSDSPFTGPASRIRKSTEKGALPGTGRFQGGLKRLNRAAMDNETVSPTTDWKSEHRPDALYIVVQPWFQTWMAALTRARSPKTTPGRLS